MRLSGTGSSGATVRMYVDTYEADKSKQLKSAGEMLAPCIDVALQISQLPKFTGRNEPTVITWKWWKNDDLIFKNWKYNAIKDTVLLVIEFDSLKIICI